MRVATLDEAIAEAQRFIKAASTLRTLIENAPNVRSFHGAVVGSPREQGAVKRASMDLTRKLADLRAGR